MDSEKSTGSREVVTVGVVGTADSIRRVMGVAEGFRTASLRMTSAVSEKETSARQQALKITDTADVILFSGPLGYDSAMADGGLPVPAVFVPPGGPALPTTLLRGVREIQMDLRRISIDSVLDRDVRDTYDEIGVDSSGVHVKEYNSTAAVAEFLDFHRDLHEARKTTVAVTTIPEVAGDLADLGIPVVTMRPDVITLRGALNTAVLVGSGASLENSRMAVVVVRLPVSESPHSTSLSNYAFQELRVSAHRELLDEARRMDATVVSRDDTSFLVMATMGSLRAATQDLSAAVFVERLRAKLGIRPQVGIGFGRSAAEAERNAIEAVERSSAERSTALYMVGPHGAVLELPRPGEEREPTPALPVQEDSREAIVLRQAVEALQSRGDDSRLVDAERVAELLGVTARTARRQLRDLADAGLAWPMPSEQTNKVGRPPVLYQLLDHRLDD